MRWLFYTVWAIIGILLLVGFVGCMKGCADVAQETGEAVKELDKEITTIGDKMHNQTMEELKQIEEMSDKLHEQQQESFEQIEDLLDKL